MPSGSLNPVYPFSAIIGMEYAKKALMCAMVNPRIRSVLIQGGSGVAKTTMARSISGDTSGKDVVNIPLNSTDEQIFGGMDIESAVRDGAVKMQKGLLSTADGNIAYIDDVNLFDQRSLIAILDASASGRVMVERGQISDSYRCSATVIATMNPRDVTLSSHVLDRFDLCAHADPIGDAGGRGDVLKRNMEFSTDPESFRAIYSEDEDKIRSKIEKAREILPLVTISDGLFSIISELCESMGADGYRGDIAMVNASLALAAIDGRDEVLKKDVEDAAVLCLTHRRNYTPDPPPPPPQEEPQDQDQDQDQDEKEDGSDDADDDPQDRPPDDRDPPSDGDGDQEGSDHDIPDLDEMMFNIGEQFKVIDYLESNERSPSKTKSRKGRRALTESGDMTGRYKRSRIVDSPRDIAFDATIRAAAPYQRARACGDLRIVIEKQDLREKVRERRSGCTLLFLVDASGSLGVRKRMMTVKGAILSMLRESYVKRDRVGMMAFRRDSAEMILPPTKSVEYSYRKLEELPTGGKTPLGEALVSVESYMTSYSRCHPGERCFIILITDGRANVPLKDGANANSEVIDLADSMSIPGVRWIVVDAGVGYPHFDNAEVLAEKLSARYFRLEDLNAEKLADGVKMMVGS